MIRNMRINFTGSTPGPDASIIKFIEALDGSIYGETNTYQLAGESINVSMVDGGVCVDGHKVSGVAGLFMLIDCPDCFDQITVREYLMDQCVKCQVIDSEKHDWEDSV